MKELHPSVILKVRDCCNYLINFASENGFEATDLNNILSSVNYKTEEAVEYFSKFKTCDKCKSDKEIEDFVFYTAWKKKKVSKFCSQCRDLSVAKRGLIKSIKPSVQNKYQRLIDMFECDNCRFDNLNSRYTTHCKRANQCQKRYEQFNELYKEENERILQLAESVITEEHLEFKLLLNKISQKLQDYEASKH